MPNSDQTARVGTRKGIQEDAVYDRENGGVCADAEGEGENSNGGKSGSFREHPEREAEVVQNRSHVYLPSAPDCCKISDRACARKNPKPIVSFPAA
jgi:hypothetical protein